jgi:hypothetical protein
MKFIYTVFIMMGSYRKRITSADNLFKTFFTRSIRRHLTATNITDTTIYESALAMIRQESLHRHRTKATGSYQILHISDRRMNKLPVSVQQQTKFKWYWKNKKFESYYVLMQQAFCVSVNNHRSNSKSFKLPAIEGFPPYSTLKYISTRNVLINLEIQRNETIVISDTTLQFQYWWCNEGLNNSSIPVWLK